MILVMAAVLDESDVRKLCDRITRAIRMVYDREKAACAEQEINRTKWAEMKRADRSLCLMRFAIRCPEAWKWVCLLTLQEDGLPLVIERTRPVIAAIQSRDYYERRRA